MTPEEELEQQSAIANAALGVAEDLGWAVALLAGLAAYLKWDSWLVTFPVTAGAYMVAIYRYRRRAAQAEDSYFRAARLGKYAGSSVANDA